MSRTLEERREQSRAEDRELIRRAVAGEQDAYARLMEKYEAMIRRLVSRMTGTSAETEDIVQEAFIKAFQALSSFNDEFSFSTWLCKIATNNCIDHLRKRKLHTVSLEGRWDEPDHERLEIPDSSALPDVRIVERQRAQAIQRAIDALPEKYRIVIVLRHQQEMRYEEIAEELKIPLGTVKAHIFRARELLNKYLRGRVDPE
ncbi:MAG: sigma-70 family RNA polymerase sigma factor [Bacteroidota bacterium]|nr:sigma-70 family RNA polymerase sigma factor [Bacteroidota bacterium]